MKEQVFKRRFAGRYESEDYEINQNFSTGTWVITRKSDKKRAFRGTLKEAKTFVNSVGATIEKNWDL